MAITDLSRLLSELNPVMDEQDYVFCTVTELPVGINPIATFHEEEGLSLVCFKAQAQAANINFQGTFKKITLTVYSSLEAVGLTAAVSNVLAKAGISANMVAAYHHDHVFVPSEQAEEALILIKGLSS
ncbi:ACT domain-containing protein [Kangiella marina]|uniref:ACT domain-containing protein n=1 Tax=Kangiella marina TaxID=1079178 RepID=A0ABP8I9U6_9GAMM